MYNVHSPWHRRNDACVNRFPFAASTGCCHTQMYIWVWLVRGFSNTRHTTDSPTGRFMKYIHWKLECHDTQYVYEVWSMTVSVTLTLKKEHNQHHSRLMFRSSYFVKTSPSAPSQRNIFENYKLIFMVDRAFMKILLDPKNMCSMTAYICI